MLKFYAGAAVLLSATLLGLPAMARSSKAPRGAITQRAGGEMPKSNLAGAVEIGDLPTVSWCNAGGDVRDMKPLPGQSPLMTGSRAAEPEAKDVPFTGTFTSEREAAQYGIINMNQDKYTWGWQSYDYCMRIWSADEVTSDDWLVLPPLNLKAGTNYKFIVSCKNMNSSSTDYTELFEVKAGQYVAMDSVNLPVTVMDVTRLKSNDWVDMQGIFSVPESGKYYVGIHYISPKWQSYMDVIKVEVKVDAGEPAPVTDLTVTPGENGARTATLKFTTPSLTAAGEPLKGIDSVCIERDEIIVDKIIGAVPGTGLVWTDNLAEAGEYRYKVYCVNEKGTSLPVYGGTYVGFDIPAMPDSAWVTAQQPLKDGKVMVGWTPVVTDTTGRALPEVAVGYQVSNLKIQGYPALAIVAPGQTSAEVSILEPGVGQTFSDLAVFPFTERGLGVGAPTSRKVVVGTPAGLPFTESFPDGEIETREIAVYNYTPGLTRWMICTDETFKGEMTSSDGDNGYLTMQSSVDGESMIYTLMADLSGARNPELSINLYNITNDPSSDDAKNTNEVTLLAREPNADTWTILKSGPIHELAPQVLAWNRVNASLSQFKGKPVQLGIRIKGKQYAFTAIDAIKVADVNQNDLALVAAAAPKAVFAGEPFNVTVNVRNNGAAAVAAGRYTLSLHEDGSATPLATIQGTALERDRLATFTFDACYAPGQAGSHDLTVVIDFADDENTTDNRAGCRVDCRVSDRPVPVALAAALDGDNKPILTWSEPDMTTRTYTGEPIVEDFENPAYTPWNTIDGGVDEWIMVDADGLPVGGFQGLTLPGIETGKTTASFFLFDSADPVVKDNQYAASYAASSGDRYLASLYQAEDNQIDDWAISPRLSGKKQEISLMARSYSATYPEKFTIYYSKGSVDPKDFIPVTGSSVEEVPAEWTLYRIELPDEARRFAIRSNSAGAFMLMIDDVKFVPLANTPSDVTGYNIYRNDVKVNDRPVTAMSYVDASAPDGVHRYYVTALYDTGEESGASNVATATSAVDLIASAGMTVTTARGEILISGAQDVVEITTVQGQVIYRNTPAEILRVKVTPGIYLLRSGNTVAKLLVR